MDSGVFCASWRTRFTSFSSRYRWRCIAPASYLALRDVSGQRHHGGQVTEVGRHDVGVASLREVAELSDADRKIIETISPRLVADGLFFVGLDVIGGKLIEVNVTSPTLIQQMARITGENLAASVVERLEAKAQAYSG